MLITVIGPDGSGKTTLAKQLTDSDPRLTYRYFGSNPESRRYIYFEKYIKDRRRGWWRTSLRYLFILFNDVAYHREAKRKHVISDRWPVDNILGSLIRKDRMRFYYHSLTQKLMPSPGLAILLIGDPDELYDRTKEVSKDVINKYIEFYRERLTRGRIMHIEIDTVENDLENTFRIATEFINKSI